MDYKERIEKEKAMRDALFATFPKTDFRTTSGIYVFWRTDTEETGLRFAYVGQAQNMIARLVQHCMGHDSHIDKSLIKRKFVNDQNPNGWQITIAEYCDEDQLNDRERYWITRIGNAGYQLLNKTSGGQDGGKVGIAPNAPSRGYRDGFRQGYANARKDVAKLFEKHICAMKRDDTKLSERAWAKWLAFLNGIDEK